MYYNSYTYFESKFLGVSFIKVINTSFKILSGHSFLFSILIIPFSFNSGVNLELNNSEGRIFTPTIK